MTLWKGRQLVGDEAADHLLCGGAFFFEQCVKISELDMRPAYQRARGFPKPDASGRARLGQVLGENLSFTLSRHLTKFHLSFPQ